MVQYLVGFVSESKGNKMLFNGYICRTMIEQTAIAKKMNIKSLLHEIDELKTEYHQFRIMDNAKIQEALAIE